MQVGNLNFVVGCGRDGSFFGENMQCKWHIVVKFAN